MEFKAVVSFSVKYKRSTEEWVTRFYYADGSERKQARYYTDDKADAISTGQATVDRAKNLNG